jgi:hypothetical protein
MQNDLIPVMSNSAVVWLPINTITFWVIPANFRSVYFSHLACTTSWVFDSMPPTSWCSMCRPIFTASLATVWVTYLSLVQHKDQP